MERTIVKQCVYCGNDFLAKLETAKFCSASHCNMWNKKFSKTLKKCKEDGCDLNHSAQGYCTNHYRKYIHYPNKAANPNTKNCSFEGCQRKEKVSGLCSFHYGRTKTKKGLVENHCVSCGANISYRQHNSLFCSKKCLRIERKKHPPTRDELIDRLGVCKIEGCEEPAKTKTGKTAGLCNKHRTTYFRHGDPTAFVAFRYNGVKCSKEGCEETATQHGMCDRHAGCYYAIRRGYRVREALPKWIDRKEIHVIYDKLHEMREACPEADYEVDHIVPLRGHRKSVCGLHVPWNLQIIKNVDNNSKNNSVHHLPTQGCDFSAPGFIGSRLYTPKSPELPTLPQPPSQGSLCF